MTTHRDAVLASPAAFIATGASSPQPSESQREAIESPASPLLVLAGPGAGKTFCLIERIRFLIERLDFNPERVCAFTFTNKAAGEIAERLARTVGPRAAQVKTGTIHAFCAELLREFGAHVGLEPGFGIADDQYQRAVLRRLGQPRYHTNILSRFGAHRFRDEPFDRASDAELFYKYQRFLADRRVVDFDMLVLKTAELLGNREVLDAVRARWEYVLVDEFQDLNPIQYAVIRDIGLAHGHVFAVGDEEQSIYSWAGADPTLFRRFLNDFGITKKVSLRENRRCPREIVSLARQLVEINTPLFAERKTLTVDRDVPDCVRTMRFRTEDEEIAWVVDDLRRDRAQHGLHWGEYALLYRKHQIGDAAEAGLLAAGLPCRLAHGRALSEDPVVAYAIAALRVIGRPDEVHDEGYLEVVLPKPLVDDAKARAAKKQRSLKDQLDRMRSKLPRDHGDKKKLHRAFYALANLRALGAQHTSVIALVEDLLAQRIGEYRTVLEEHHDELTDPRAHPEVVSLADRLLRAIQNVRPVCLPRLGGVEIPLKGMLVGLGIRTELGDTTLDAEHIAPGDAPTLGLPLALFKALQLVRSGGFTNRARDFTAIDVETTDRDVKTAELVEIAAVRVRDGLVVDEFHSLVKPSGPIAIGAAKTHGLSDADVADAPPFAEVWPKFRAFCGDDVLVAHNGYQFDFPILERLAGEKLTTYDTLPLARDLHPGSKKLVDLARHFGIDSGTSHRALDDTRTLARVYLALGEAKVIRARKTALVNLLDYLGLALALGDDDGMNAEVALLKRFARFFALGRYSDCLEFYRAERELAHDATLPTVSQVIERLGGERLLQRVRAKKSASQRYPAAMARLRRLLDQCVNATEPLGEQIAAVLERVALSKSDGAEVEHDRVNLLTLHSTKGLEFSRVYILGVEDAQLPGMSPTKSTSKMETEEARRLLYVGMTRAKDKLTLTRVEARNGQPTGGTRFLGEMGLTPVLPAGTN